MLNILFNSAPVPDSGSGWQGKISAAFLAAVPNPFIATLTRPLRPTLPSESASVAGFPIDLSADAPTVARALIGCTVLVDGIGGRIVETEAYDRDDPASHTFGGPSGRNAAMFGPPGHAYIYRSYGLHWCFNIVCREDGHGAGVLIRALEPTEGIETMRARRGMTNDRLLCAGPGRLTQALAISQGHYGLSVFAPPFALIAPSGPVDVIAGPRIGISKAIDLPWRFGERGSPYVSKPFKPATLIEPAA